ncbi:MAG: NAD(P)H-dependent oxidoreductase subunit E [Deltaproteobacteria bacterium]|nr:NAD(P)H-dependent oxidoreductase subunit E [Deltaproteobacteria bacterium]MBN2670483.1 NAD(P)H-dependent oxidoreductase subunit E [Deltaproteobacteria bacterium]
MFATEREQLEQDIETFAAIYGNERSALISILQEVQRKHKHVSQYAMQVIAHVLDIHPVEVYSVVSFYHFLSEEPKGQYVISLSDCVAHNADAKRALARQLQNDLGIGFGETSSDGRFTLEKIGCIGMCDQGPVLRVNGRIYTEVTADRVGGLICDCASDIPSGSICDIGESI